MVVINYLVFQKNYLEIMFLNYVVKIDCLRDYYCFCLEKDLSLLMSLYVYVMIVILCI